MTLTEERKKEWYLYGADGVTLVGKRKIGFATAPPAAQKEEKK